ncbi:XRE family transcriptional regulator [Cereibacter sphaeroides]|nr:XRE family transcriptional regulator [Cereibacter sphaeroides]
MTQTESTDQVGANLRRARGQAGLSLSATAEVTGVSKAMLGQIERGESSPTLATLWKLCKGLQLPLTALIGAPLTPSMPGPTVPSGGAAPRGIKESPTFRTLFPFDPKTGCEVFLHDLTPHWEHCSAAHSDGVIEDVFVLQGAVEILLGEAWHRIDAGQALRFKADQPHGYRNPLASRSRFHNTIHYPGLCWTNS